MVRKTPKGKASCASNSIAHRKTMTLSKGHTEGFQLSPNNQSLHLEPPSIPYTSVILLSSASPSTDTSCLSSDRPSTLSSFPSNYLDTRQIKYGRTSWV
ncbi:hypothetical protein BC938DRAFT_478797 [Jimgerdemannia flammicorona]|uniref:Uncharacterized protein n=1 Tax=Jimgerdemannia flammicorona TaxID=994334 RepID=A0A433QM85_9FUNG|nr:hypothetical protein BC938DRAFT_478797 [Jimgerdemannia flammicorona]